MKQQIENVRRQIGELSSLAEKTDAAERKILESAEKRIDWVQSRMGELRAKALTDGDAGKEYQSLAMERSRLNLVIAQARKNIGG